MSYILQRASGQKKYKITTPEGKHISFGAAGYEDYTMHHDKDRRSRYLLRHGGENWNDKSKAGFWARWLLWNKKSLQASIRDVKKRFNINVKLQSGN